MSIPSPQSRDELLAQVRHLRELAADQLDARLCRTALDLADEYERQAAEMEPEDWN